MRAVCIIWFVETSFEVRMTSAVEEDASLEMEVEADTSFEVDKSSEVGTSSDLFTSFEIMSSVPAVKFTKVSALPYSQKKPLHIVLFRICAQAPAIMMIRIMP